MSEGRKEDAVLFKSTCYVVKLTAPFSKAVHIPNNKQTNRQQNMTVNFMYHGNSK
jgi:hypothetical protein